MTRGILRPPVVVNEALPPLEMRSLRVVLATRRAVAVRATMQPLIVAPIIRIAKRIAVLIVAVFYAFRDVLAPRQVARSVRAPRPPPGRP